MKILDHLGNRVKLDTMGTNIDWRHDISSTHPSAWFLCSSA